MFSEQNDFFMTLVIFIHFVSYYVWKWHALFMYYICGIEETTLVKKHSIILVGIKYKQLRCENYFYRIFQ